MPTALEAGTLNVHGIAGLGAGVRWLLTQGVEALEAKGNALARLFLTKSRPEMPGVTVYGDDSQPRAPIVSLNLIGEDSARVADVLWEEYGICVRAGAHCAPLMHRALGTVEQGVVRFSFFHTAIPWKKLCTLPGRAGAGTGAVNAHKKDLYRALLPHNGGSHGLGKKHCATAQIPGRLIPLPREISAGCGLAWRMTPEDWEHWNSLLDPAAYDAVSQVEQ